MQRATVKQRLLLLLATIAQLLLAYIFISFAINSGSLWEYGLTLVFFIWGLRSIGQFIRTFIDNGKRKARKA